MWRRFRLTSGVRKAALLGLLAPGLSGCLYGFNAGTGFQLNTIAILPFENETTRFELSQEIHELLLRELPGALGLTLAGEAVADAVLSGTVRDYTLRAPNYRAGAQQGDRPQVLQRQVSLSVAVQVLDVTENLVLWESTSLRTQGQYIEGSEDEDVAKLEALELLVQGIVDGLQSNW
jgi:hypothetical protein